MRVPTKLWRHSVLMLIEATTLSKTSTCQLTTHQYSGTMRIYHMEVECIMVQDRCRTFNDSMLHIGSKDSINKQVREQKIRGKGDLIHLKIRC